MLLLHWELPLGTESVGFNYLFIFPPGYVVLWGSKAHHRLASEYFLVFGNLSLFKDSFPMTDLFPYLFCLSFYLLYFFLPPFKDNGLLFWVPDVLCWHSEVVLWNLLSVQMFFWWICWGESGLPVLFLRHLRTASLRVIIKWLCLAGFIVVYLPRENTYSVSVSLWEMFLPSGLPQ